MANPLLAEGLRAPAFTLPSQDGERIRLTGFRGRWVVLYFYPKDMTPGCTLEACEFRDRAAQFKRRGAVILGVSPDDSASHQEFLRKYKLPFPLLVDRDSKIAARYGVWREKSNYGRKYMGIVRSTFLIDPSGKLARIFDNLRVKGHAEKVLMTLKDSESAG